MAAAVGRLDLTVKEAAELAGVSTRRIEKSVEEGVFPKKRVAMVLRRNKAAHVPIHVVAYASAIKRMKGVKLDVASKKRLFREIMSTKEELGVISLIEGMSLSLDKLADTEWKSAWRYVRAREEHLTSDEAVFGGEPIIKNTRITCRSVLGRIKDGDTIDYMSEENPDVAREAFEAALIYARTHPPRGRPEVGKPWRKPAKS